MCYECDSLGDNKVASRTHICIHIFIYTKLDSEPGGTYCSYGTKESGNIVVSTSRTLPLVQKLLSMSTNIKKKMEKISSTGGVRHKISNF